jgi:hypothetical protein
VDNPQTNHSVPPIGRHESDDVRPPDQPADPRHIEIDDSKILAAYANFCRLSGTPEELLIDFGFQPVPHGASSEPVAVTQRIVTSWHTAKRLLQVLQMSLQRHESAFGHLETDVQTRAGQQR